VTKERPDWLQPYKQEILSVASSAPGRELRWHVAQMLPRLELAPSERRAAISLMFSYLNDESRIVQTFALQALADFASGDTALRSRLLPLLGNFSESGSPAIRARARKLVKRLTE
jgi:hypothetical protein